MSTKSGFRLSIRYLAALFAAGMFCAAGIGFAAGTRRVPELKLEMCAVRNAGS